MNYDEITPVLKTIITLIIDGIFWNLFFLNITTEHKEYTDYIYMIVYRFLSSEN